MCVLSFLLIQLPTCFFTFQIFSLVGMAWQYRVPKEAIVNRIKHTTNGESNAKKVIEHIEEEKRKKEAIAKQRRQIGSKPKTLQQRKNKMKYGKNEL